jgi:hypothetical protein
MAVPRPVVADAEPDVDVAAVDSCVVVVVTPVDAAGCDDDALLSLPQAATINAHVASAPRKLKRPTFDRCLMTDPPMSK